MEKDYKAQASEKVKKIIAKIRETTAMAAYSLTLIKDSTPDIFDSKFGGVPYWDLTKDYPLDSNQKKMMLLAQINFSKAALEDERLPKQGMLQFFLASEDYVYGLDSDEADSQKNFRVIYHETINPSYTKEQVLALDIPITTSADTEYTPVFKEAALEISKKTAFLGPDDYRFDKVFCQTVKELFGENVPNQNIFCYLSEEDSQYLYEELYNSGHWILGYPLFTQSDPRDNREDDYYDTLLFQMDSEMIGNEYYVLWGDVGVANFFINEEALKNKDFNKIMYNWDCC